ncbi:MAG: CYTH domain-containing protein [Nitrososphaerota archaeon]|nr:CYTH domain-containing protein [Nitrososphaerota archaeon]
MKAKPVVVVEVAGGSASGKTTFAKALVSRFGAKLIPQDDYYRGITWMKANAPSGQEFNFDQPEVFNLELLAEHLGALADGRPVEKPVYDYKQGESPNREMVTPSRVLVVEGLFALYGPMKGVGDLKVFVDVAPHGRLIRRMMRDIKRTSWDAKTILSYCLDVVEPMYERYIAPEKAEADVVVINDYDPAKEADRAILSEVQVKYRVDDAAKARTAIERLGGAFISDSTQFDTYFTPRKGAADRETVRLRSENDAVVFTYKGPNDGKTVSRRPSFIVQLDGDVSDQLARMYKEQVRIDKERTFYTLNGMIVTVDVVVADFKLLGTFIEAQLPRPELAPELDGLRDALKLGAPITKSYLELATE